MRHTIANTELLLDNTRPHRDCGSECLPRRLAMFTSLLCRPHDHVHGSTDTQGWQAQLHAGVDVLIRKMQMTCLIG